MSQKAFIITAGVIEYGIFYGESEQDARDACARDAGYESEAHMAQTLERANFLVATEISRLQSSL